MAYAIGETVWRGGCECRITTEPYAMAKGAWQDALNLETGKTVMVPTPESTAASVAKQHADWHEMQAGFKRLRDLERSQA